ncbi:ABC transporter ATP-binding protein [Paenibacillus sp. GSMTC-2017]|uniref:ABC transporter ATP-binding protein n=1 Tax=Paenibacillus sp. GSMTC-2017 TaxID=2794350 RepID=UPI0018D77E4C|nr:ABC transporter ATP-binding protein [Paenibacillus sp. GSMTC-2017]MBH5319287.1 ABC transporter ATP-binding protein [Paenibacillus sp. GSMTC-2017]
MFDKLKEPFRYPRMIQMEDVSNKVISKDTAKQKPKVKDAATTLKRLWLYLMEYRLKLVVVIVLIILSTIFSLLGPYLAGTAIDHYISKHNSGFIPFLIVMAVVYILHAFTLWLQNIWMIGISQGTVKRMRMDLFSHLHKLPIPFFGKRQHGELMSRMTNDIENVSSSLNSAFIQLFSSVLLLTGIVSVMLSLSPMLTVITFMIVPLMIIGMNWITNKTSRLFKSQQRNLGDMNGFVEETLSGQRIVKAFSQEQTVIHKFKLRNERIHASGFWAQTISGFIPKLMNGLNNLSFALIAGIGALLILNGSSITIGVIVIFAEFSRQFTRPLNDLANQWNTMLSAIAGAERVFQILDEEIEGADEENAVRLKRVEGKVEFQNVSFAYDSGNAAISNVTFTASQGETVAFVGPTGAGKTTLLAMLCRFYEPNSGQIRIDDRNINEIQRESLRSHMAFVLQDPLLFEGTIRENIRYGRLEATDQEVEAAAIEANAHSFIMRMKGSYDAKLKLDGSGISQGQKQLIAIARAILANPSILVLDEATSSIDTITEMKIQEALQRLMKGRTSFVIAHRLNTIEQAHQIIVLQDGAVVERGSHSELVHRNGYFNRLVKRQFVRYE